MKNFAPLFLSQSYQDTKELAWLEHNRLERGNPVRIYEGGNFVRRDRWFQNHCIWERRSMKQSGLYPCPCLPMHFCFYAGWKPHEGPEGERMLFIVTIYLLIALYYVRSAVFRPLRQHNAFWSCWHLRGREHLPPDKYLRFPDIDSCRRCFWAYGE